MDEPYLHIKTRRADYSNVDIAQFYAVRPLEAQCEGGLSGWSVRLPVRAERVTVDKCAFVRVEAMVRRIERPDVVHVTDAVRHEQLRVATHGNLEVEHHQCPH